MQSERHTTAREDTQSTRRCDAWLRIRNLWWQTQTRSTRRWEWKEEFFTNYVNRSVVVQILTGHEVKYRERIINGLRTREWGWVYEKKKRNVDRLRFQKGLLFLYQSNQCSPCKAFLSVVAGCWHGTFVGLKKLSHQSTETTNTTEDV